MVFTKHLCLFALEVLFALSCWGKQPCPVVFMHHNTESPAIGLSRRRSRWLWRMLPNHIPSSLPLLKQLVSCTVDARCNFSVYYHLWEWDLFMNIPFYRQYSTIYLYVSFFFLCQSVHLNYIVHMQMIWTLCFRIYGLFCTWWLICTPTSPAPPSIHIVVILCYDDGDISNEGTCFNATSIIWT